MSRKRDFSDVEDKITLDFETPETLRDSYVKSLKEWNDGIKRNQDMMTIFTVNNISFLFLVLLGVLAYTRPEIVPAFGPEELNIAKTLEMRDLASAGLPYDVVVKKVEEYAQTVSQVRFSFQGGQMMTASEILQFLKENPTLLPLITQLETVFNILKGSFNVFKFLLCFRMLII